MSATEQKNFRTKLVEEFPGITIDHWPGSEIQRLMRDTEGGRLAARHFFRDPEAETAALKRVAALGGELTEPSQAVGRLAVIGEFLAQDAHFRYTLHLSEQGGEPGEPSPSAFLSLDVQVSDKSQVRVDVSERHAGALGVWGPRAKFVFTDDEAGRRAREAVEQVEREGGEVHIQDGMAIEIERIPNGLDGLMPRRSAGAVTITSREVVPEPVEPVLPVRVSCGGLDLAIPLVGIEPPNGFDLAVGGELGGLSVAWAMREEGGRVVDRLLDWRWKAGIGSASEQLLALSFLIAGLEGEQVEMRPVGEDRIVMSGTLEEADDEGVEGLRARESFLRHIAELEAWTGQSIYPPAEIDDAEVVAAAKAVARIRVAETSIEWTASPVEADPTKLPDDLSVNYRIAQIRPYWLELFGEQIPLWEEMVFLEEAKLVVEATEVQQALEEGRSVSVTLVPPAEPGRGQARIRPPSESTSFESAPSSSD
ncbi:MAG: hypothetical protein ACJ760_07150 [Thermoleophilaceae bacterium]